MLSVLIVNWNTRDLLRACLASIHRFPPDEPYEVIVVDNASSDGSAEMVKDGFPWVRLIEPGANTGYAKGNNIAFGAAKGEWFLTLNPDTEFEDKSIQIALNELRVKTDFGACAVRLVGPDGRRQDSIRAFPTVGGILSDLMGKGDKYRLSAFDYTNPGPAPQPMGTFLLFRRKALEAVGDPHAPFDERFPIFFNEVDLLKRMADKGWPCWYSAAGHVVHHHGASTSKVKKAMVWESHKSLVRYFGKHLRFPALLLLPLIAVAAYMAAFVRAKGYHAGFRH